MNDALDDFIKFRDRQEGEDHGDKRILYVFTIQN
jgi:hypothetical protein